MDDEAELEKRMNTNSIGICCDGWIPTDVLPSDNFWGPSVTQSEGYCNETFKFASFVFLKEVGVGNCPPFVEGTGVVAAPVPGVLAVPGVVRVETFAGVRAALAGNSWLRYNMPRVAAAPRSGTSTMKAAIASMLAAERFGRAGPLFRS